MRHSVSFVTTVSQPTHPAATTIHSSARSSVAASAERSSRTSCSSSLDGERTKQDAFAAVDLAGTPFASLTGGFSQPFRESNLLGKVDYNFGNGAKAFYRYSYFANSLYATFNFGFQVYDNKDYTRTSRGRAGLQHR